MKKILLLGASGLLGHNVLLELIKRGFEVIAPVRSRSRLHLTQALFSNPNLKVVEAADIVAFLSAFKEGEADAIVNCAGITDMSLLRYEDYLPVNRDLCRYIVEHAERLHIATIVHVSTANTIGFGTPDSPGHEGDAMSSPFAESFYARSKREGEELLLLGAQRNPDGHIVILNPGFMVGPYDAKPSSGKLLMAAYKRRWMATPSGGKSFVHVNDVAKAVVNALSMGGNGERYLLTGRELTLRQFYTLQAQVCGYRQHIVQLPDVVVRLAGRLGDLLRRLGIATQLSTCNVRQLLVREYYSTDKSIKDLAYTLSPLEEAIKDFFCWQNEKNV